jgi:hypothetical protein
MSQLSELRTEVYERAQGKCEWPGCADPGQHLAHLTHRGMGGSKTRNTADNCAWLCVRHHDILDGRTGLGTLRWELNELMRHAIHH